VRPSSGDVVSGGVTSFLDTLGIGNYAQITALFKLHGHPPDELIPGFAKRLTCPLSGLRRYSRASQKMASHRGQK
jgi:hypothetical protein